MSKKSLFVVFNQNEFKITREAVAVGIELSLKKKWKKKR